MDDVAAILKSVVAEKQRRGNKYVVEEGGGMKAGRDQVTQRLQGRTMVGWKKGSSVVTEVTETTDVAAAEKEAGEGLRKGKDLRLDGGLFVGPVWKWEGGDHVPSKK